MINKLLSEALDASSDLVCICDAESMDIVFVNRSFQTVLGCDDSVTGKSLCDTGLWKEPDSCCQIFESVKSEGAVEGHTTELVSKNGPVKSVEIYAFLFQDQRQNLIVCNYVLLDELIEVHRAMNVYAAFYKAMFSSSSEPIVVLEKGIITDCNEVFAEMMGRSRNTAVGYSIEDAINSAEHITDAELGTNQRLTPEDRHDVQYVRLKIKGQLVIYNLVRSTIHIGERYVTLLTLNDVTNVWEKKEAETLEAEGSTNTALMNEKAFLKHAQEIIDQHSDSHFRVVIMSLSNMKLINELMGYGMGDSYINLVASTLLVEQANGSIQLAGQLHGNSFLLLFKTLPDNQLNNRVTGLLNEVERILEQEEVGVYITVKAAMSQHGRSAVQLYEQAAEAISNNKARLSQQVEYTSAVAESRMVKATILTSARKALRDKEFFNVYQKIYDINSLQVKGYESLIRWNSSELNDCTPGVFIPILEMTPVIIDVTLFSLERALEHIHQYQLIEKQQYISINLAPSVIEHKDSYKRLVAMLQAHKVLLPALKFEITERTEFKADELRQRIVFLRGLGIRMSLDDFGTGYASLSKLKGLPFDELKIDIEFIRTLEASDTGKDFVSTIISLARLMNAKTVAEGVESEEQLSILKRLGCDLVQGYYLSKPEPF